jgi:hypothetical protein
MNHFALNRPLDNDAPCTELLSMAQRELTAFFRAASALFGKEQAELSVEDWLREVEANRTLPASTREWRQVTVKVIAQLAERCGRSNVIPTNARLQPASY